MLHSKRVIVFMLVLGIATSSAQTRRENEPYCDPQGAKKVEIADADAAIGMNCRLCAGHFAMGRMKGTISQGNRRQRSSRSGK